LRAALACVSVGHRRHTANENGSDRRAAGDSFLVYYHTTIIAADDQSCHAAASVRLSPSKYHNITFIGGGSYWARQAACPAHFRALLLQQKTSCFVVYGNKNEIMQQLVTNVQNDKRLLDSQTGAKTEFNAK